MAPRPRRAISTEAIAAVCGFIAIAIGVTIIYAIVTHKVQDDVGYALMLGFGALYCAIIIPAQAAKDQARDMAEQAQLLRELIDVIKRNPLTRDSRALAPIASKDVPFLAVASLANLAVSLIVQDSSRRAKRQREAE